MVLSIPLPYPAPDDPFLPEGDRARLGRLAAGRLAVLGRFLWGSNATLLCRLEGVAAPPEEVHDLAGLFPDAEGLEDLPPSPLAVYKPCGGERPLWDFPAGSLCRRETAAYLVSALGGWGIVPPTLLREGPYGPGAVQAFVAAVPDAHYFTLADDPRYRPWFQLLAAFDVVVNNADRKSGHCLLDRQGRLWGIDHGICFHAEPKLRTVIWEFARQPLPEGVVRRLERTRQALEGPLAERLAPLLAAEEIEALGRRLEDLLAAGRYPEPGPPPHLPWPLV